MLQVSVYGYILISGGERMKLYTVSEVADLLGFKEGTIRKKIYSGEIKTAKITGSNAVRVSQEEIDRLTGKG